MAYQDQSLAPIEYKDRDEELTHPFFDYIQMGDLATAEEIAGALLEVLRLKQNLGHEVGVSLAHWESRREILKVIIDSRR